MEYRYVLDKLKKYWKKTIFLSTFLFRYLVILLLLLFFLHDHLLLPRSVRLQFSGICDVFLGLISMRLFRGYFEFHCYGRNSTKCTIHVNIYVRTNDIHCYTLWKYITPNREFKWMWKSCSVRLTLILNHIIKIFFSYFIVQAIFFLVFQFTPSFDSDWCFVQCTVFASVLMRTHKHTRARAVVCLQILLNQTTVFSVIKIHIVWTQNPYNHIRFAICVTFNNFFEIAKLT